MKRLILCLLCLSATAAVAQPPARLKEAQAKTLTTNTPQGSAYRDFPTAQTMPADAAWRRDIYRSVDLTTDANAVLYYPTQPTNGRENLFTYLFKLLLRGQIKAYDYKLDGNENFTEANRVKAKDIMDRYQIFYESKDGRMRVNDADLPSDEVKVYFVKESTYYDQHTATFHTQVTAICPVLKRTDEFGGEGTQYPMFWVSYADIAPYLAKLSLMGSSLNNAASLSADDYFTMNRYEGKIYRTVNLQDKILSNYCTTDSALTKEQNRIEKQITDFKKHVWGQDSVPQQPKDSLAATETNSKVKKTRTPRRRASADTSSGSSNTEKKAPAVEQKRSRTTRSGGASYSVRRQRH